MSQGEGKAEGEVETETESQAEGGWSCRALKLVIQHVELPLQRTLRRLQL